MDTENERAEWIFPAEPSAVRAARHEVRDALSAWRLPSCLADVAVLLVSELVTNSCCYASGPIRVSLYALNGGCPVPTRHALLVEISDPLPELPVVRVAGPDDEGGRGLQLLASAATRWGARHGTAGKTVWFELPLHG